jgi:hypothetical protein
MPYNREAAILTIAACAEEILAIAACAEEILDGWGEAKGMDFSESVPSGEVEAIVSFLRADSVAGRDLVMDSFRD